MRPDCTDEHHLATSGPSLNLSCCGDLRIFYREYRLTPQEVDLQKSLVNFADENVIPFWGDPDDWGFDRKLQMWMYYGEDKELKERYWEELDAFMDPATCETSDD